MACGWKWIFTPQQQPNPTDDGGWLYQYYAAVWWTRSFTAFNQCRVKQSLQSFSNERAENFWGWKGREFGTMMLVTSVLGFLLWVRSLCTWGSTKNCFHLNYYFDRQVCPSMCLCVRPSVHPKALYTSYINITLSYVHHSAFYGAYCSKALQIGNTHLYLICKPQ